MKIKNNSNKPIGIGIVNLLPGETQELPAEYVGHPTVEYLAEKLYDDEHTFVTLITETEKEVKTVVEEVKSEAEEVKTAAELKKMTLAELTGYAVSLGIEVKEGATKAVLTEAIVNAQGADKASEA